MFAAILNGDGGPVEPDTLGLAAEEVRILGRRRQVALLRSSEASPIRDAETCDIQCLDDRFWIVGRFRFDARRDLAAIDRTLAALFATALAAMLALGIGAAVLVGWLTRRRLSRIDATARENILHRNASAMLSHLVKLPTPELAAA